MLGKIEGKRRWGWQRMRWLDNITDSMDNEFEQTPGNSGKEVSLACCGLWDHRVRPVQWLNNSNSSRVFPGQGLNPCLLHWQAEFLPLSYQGSPLWLIFNFRLRSIVRSNWSNPLTLHIGETDAGEVEQWVQGHLASCSQLLVLLRIKVFARCGSYSMLQGDVLPRLGIFWLIFSERTKASKHEWCLWKVGG